MPSKRPSRDPDPQPDGPYDDEAEEEEAAAPPAPPQRERDEEDLEEGGVLRVRGGWTDAQKQMESTSNWASTFKPDENIQFIKFLEDQSFANFKRHWIERASTTPGSRNVRAYTCLKTFDGEDCPLCKIGEKPQAVASYNIAIVGDDGQLIRKAWEVTPRVFGVLKAYAHDPKISPLNKGFFMVNKSGGGKSGIAQINVSPIRASSMEEDYDMTVPPQEEFDKLERYTPDIIEITPKKTLRDIANELADEDYDD